MDKLDVITNQIMHRLFNGGDYLTKEETRSIIKLAILKYHQEQSQPSSDPYKDESFKTFYEKYGKKVGRITAHRRWMKLKKADIEKILDTVDDFVRSTPDPQYRPHPATYLSQRRWEDEIGPVKKAPVTAAKNTWSYA